MTRTNQTTADRIVAIAKAHDTQAYITPRGVVLQIEYLDLATREVGVIQELVTTIRDTYAQLGY